MHVDTDLYLTADVLGEKAVKAELTGKARKQKIRQPDGSEKEVLQVEVLVKNERFWWTINATSLRRIVKKYGRETENWAGKEITLTKEKKRVFGVEKEVIFAEV